jgi:formylglycine-generating enzyme required for sulfatase activity
MQKNNPDVFIAFSRVDRSAAVRLAQRLRDEGMEPWLDADALYGGDNFRQAIEEALSQCTSCVIIVGIHSHIVFTNTQSQGTFKAIERRLSQGNFRVIPVLLPGADWNELRHLPAFLHATQWIEFQESMDDEKSFQRLVDAIRLIPVELSGANAEIQSISETGTIHTQIKVRKTILLPDIDWVVIPAGPFIYGKEDRQQTFELSRFYIGRYPVTHAQYQTFIDAGGYREARWWRDLIQPEPKESRWKQPNRPRDTVDWYEAVAFTRWLSAQLGYVITLPTEQQWEKAARGSDGRVYPWGNAFHSGDANVNDTSASKANLSQTSAVGLYPHGHSPFGVADMAGNVWEWCLNKYKQPNELEPDSGTEGRVLRGGSWDNSPGNTRSAFRLRLNPVSRDDHIGFRVVCSSPFPEH